MGINNLHLSHNSFLSITRIIVITLLSLFHVESWAQTQDYNTGIVFEQGGIDVAGRDASRTDRVRSNMIAVDGEFSAALSAGYQYNFFYYTSNGVFDHRDGDTFLRGTQQRSYTGFIRILIAPAKGKEISPDEDFGLELTGNVDTRYSKKQEAIRSLPSFYHNYMTNRFDQISELEEKVYEPHTSFVFLSDTHLGTQKMRAPSLIRSLCSYTGSRQVVWNGDAIPAYSNATTPEGCKNDILNYWAKQQSWFTDSLAEAADVYPLRGNHDLTIKMQSASSSSIRKQTGYTFSQEEVQQYVCGFMKDREEVHFNPYSQGCYYYFDRPESKTRFLVLDGDSKSNISGDFAWGNNEAQGISEEQEKWVKTEVLTTIPSGYSLFVFCHEGLMDITYPHSNVRLYANMLTELERFANREGEYAELVSAPVIVMNGHKHQDLQCLKNGILHVGTSCEAPNQDNKYGMFMEDSPRRVRGTITESLFDYVIPDFANEQLHCVRIGAGFDRDFHLKTISMRVGERKRLTPQHLQAASWHSYDVEGNTYDYSTKVWTIMNTVVTIDAGTIEPQKEGDAMVFAKGSDGRKEFWCIHVEGEMPLSEYQDSLAALVATAKSLLSEMPEEMGNDLRKAVDEYNKEWTTIAEYDAAINAIESAIAEAKEMMDNMTNGVRDIQSRRGDDKEVFYNLQGQRINKPSKGIYIVNGQKKIYR